MAEKIVEFTDNCILVRIPKSIKCETLYNATRRCWPLDIEKAKKADYVLAISKDEIVVGVFKPEKWTVTTDKECEEEREKRCKCLGVDIKPCKDKKRIRFCGIEAPVDVKNKYLHKEIHPAYRKHGWTF